ncbi:hypothetical protein CY34DRAFT_799878 [Suillus luteus UH-Slu-Lm8-n1]|uniref:Uncharacterized protein n=1 Tax=Suillus luteus UH-Slu-Lm8-n1 TaxID=930992 RepID=A0A0D0BV54_9AGAM|nr:hypothetical protein CY34DRAFT_799878 [Suillus luteus UH-Slu-Lm8-n1]
MSSMSPMRVSKELGAETLKFIQRYALYSISPQFLVCQIQKHDIDYLHVNNPPQK